MSVIQGFGEEFQRASKNSLDASVRSLGEVSKGFQAIATETAEYSKKAYEANVAHMEALMSVKSLETAIELNTSFAKSSIEGYLAELNKLGEMYSDIAKQSYAPLGAHFRVRGRNFGSRIARLN